MKIDKKTTHRVPGLVDETRSPGVVEVLGRFAPRSHGAAGTFSGWGPKLG